MEKSAQYRNRAKYSKIDTLRLRHLNFNHDKFVSYGKRSLPHSSGDYRV